jgi:hypothetical protein
MRIILLFLATVFFSITFSVHTQAQASVREPISFVEITKGGKGKPCNANAFVIRLKDTPAQFLCADEYTLENIQNELSYMEESFRNGYSSVASEIEYRKNSISELEPTDPYTKQTEFILKVIEKYAAYLCATDTSSIEVRVPTTLYKGFSLTPSCTVPKDVYGASKISVEFINANNQSRTYTANDTQFPSYFTVNETGKGKHTITCSFTPNYCLAPRIATKNINVQVASKVQKQKKSVARIWNEAMLSAIGVDRVRPPVQARNLHHLSAMMYDVWSLYNPKDSPFLVNTVQGGTKCSVQQFGTVPKNSLEEVLSYAAYRIITERFKESPGYEQTMFELDEIMNSFGYNGQFTNTKSTPNHQAAAFGNFIAQCYLAYGLNDGSNEEGSHANRYYSPINTAIDPKIYGNSTLSNPDRWQPISIEQFVDQGGTPVSNGAETFIAAEWGNVLPFALTQKDKKILKRDGQTYSVYLDPGLPPLANGPSREEYVWNYMLAGIWSSHLDPKSNVKIDISPASLGATSTLPTTFSEMKQFYKLTEGGTTVMGRAINPFTKKPYAKQIVPLGDYTRVIAEYWADGPDSVTPPGHWFEILNSVNDNPALKRQLWGKGKVLSAIEWDVKTYFTLGGAMHDAAISAWSIKGYYDNIRPISVIRALGQAGQSSDPTLPSYSIKGLPLTSGFIELVGKNDPLLRKNRGALNKVKIRAWKGPEAIFDPWEDTAGVDWILAGKWWPYQRPSFVTPPFGGYVSGHSTFSRAGAEVLTQLTGSEYFPGGIYEVPIVKNEYLVFENGPSTDLTLQWATYTDAADSCSLSRIWGGIHTPIDDVAGRKIGLQVGNLAIQHAKSYFAKQ